MFKTKGAKKHTKALKHALGEYDLPSFPAVVMRVLEDIREEASAAEVARSLSADPGLSVKVLAMVNTAAYAPRRSVDNLAQAVAMLGMSNLESVVLGASVKAVLPRPVCDGFEADRFWLAAAKRAAAGRALARLLHPATQSESFTAGLLQDMAVPLLAASRPREYGPVLEAWNAGDADLSELEQSALGFDHSEVALWLCEAWSLPAALRDAVAGHHRPAGTVAGCPAAAALVSSLRESEGRDGANVLIERAGEEFGLSTDDVAALVQESFENATELARLLESN